MTTLHGRQDLPSNPPFYRYFQRYAARFHIARTARRRFLMQTLSGPFIMVCPLDLHRAEFNPQEGYLAFLGRISPEKDPIQAIRIARALNMKLKIAAKVDRADEQYFREQVKPLLTSPVSSSSVRLGKRTKGSFLRNASALLFPICWPEPFGLVMIEAMACGTPVLAFDWGSVPEVIDDGVTGRVVTTFEEAVAMLPQGSQARSS